MARQGGSGVARGHDAGLLGALVGGHRVPAGGELRRRHPSAPLSSIWSYDDLKDELWFDFLPKDHPFHSIRPIDRFIPEAYGVLYPVPGNRPARVHYHYCGESLVPTGLAYDQWLELLFRSRGAFYWLQLTLGPEGGVGTWVEEGIERIASLFPDFAPSEMRPKKAFEEIDC